MLSFARPVTRTIEFVGLIHRGMQHRVQHPTLVPKNSPRFHLIIKVMITAFSLGSKEGTLTPVPSQFLV